MLLGAPVAPEVASPQAVVDAINAVYDRAADEHDKLMEDLETEDLESVAHELEEPTTSSTPTTRRRSSASSTRSSSAR